MAVGSFLVLGAVHYYAASKKGMEQADEMIDRALLALVPVIGLAMLASLFHLGNPVNAPRAIANLGTSWLSREVLGTVVFAVLAVIFAVMQWRKISSFAVRNVIAWITAAVGVFLVYSMARVYMISAAPSWNNMATPVLFYVTTLLLGALAMGAAFVANYAYIQRKSPGCADDQCELMRGALRGIAIASIVLLGVEFVVLPFYTALLTVSGAAGLESAQLMAGPLSLTFILRLVLAFIGAGIIGIFLYQNAASPGQEKVLSLLAYSAFLLVLVAEVLGRYAFYAAHVRLGI
jgi:anaerobic dimethyl sulfoxide reductase subunit C (anchor subunit)